MSKKKIVVAFLLLVLMIVLDCAIITGYRTSTDDKNIDVNVTMISDMEQSIQVYYAYDKASNGEIAFTEDQSVKVDYTNKNKEQILTFTVPATVQYVRLDFGDKSSQSEISSFWVQYKEQARYLEKEEIINTEVQNNIRELSVGEEITISSDDGDPYIVWNASNWNIGQIIEQQEYSANLLKKIMLCLGLALAFIFILCFYNTLSNLAKEIFHNKKLILSLSKNDFKMKFAGSYLGTVWAFVQPIVTVLVYWFVFEKGLKANGINLKAGIQIPYVLWLVAGLVPWFFFQDGWNGGTNALIEYSYLVKKVVFKISILPIVKLISALFVHVFFIAFTLVLYMAYGYRPDLYTLQIIYYSFCMFMLVMGLSYATSAIVIFFRDLTQVINIVLQVGVWMTPIMWNIDSMKSELPAALLVIFKLNPMYYVVAGYREAFISKAWFWENPELTIYFWVLAIALLGIGTTIFKRLKVHFADVL